MAGCTLGETLSLTQTNRRYFLVLITKSTFTSFSIQIPTVSVARNGSPCTRRPAGDGRLSGLVPHRQPRGLVQGQGGGPAGVRGEAGPGRILLHGPRRPCAVLQLQEDRGELVQGGPAGRKTQRGTAWGLVTQRSAAMMVIIERQTYL